jgi:hypothetical protein
MVQVFAAGHFFKGRAGNGSAFLLILSTSNPQ